MNKDIPRCGNPICNSGNGYVLKDGTFQCRKCGEATKKGLKIMDELLPQQTEQEPSLKEFLANNPELRAEVTSGAYDNEW